MSFSSDGWYADAVRYDSPNWDQRPPGTAIDLLVIHNASLPAGEFGTPHMLDLFTNRIDFAAHPTFESLRGLEVSAHFFIRRDGKIVQLVSADARAWHAGISRFGERDNCNAFSIGIEMEGSDFVVFSPTQYTALATLTAALVAHYPIANIAGHEHIAPGRKTDPGPFFEWKNYSKMVRELVGPHRQLGFPACQDKYEGI